MAPRACRHGYNLLAFRQLHEPLRRHKRRRTRCSIRTAPAWAISLWKKETLVDLTFSQMLDEQVKHSPISTLSAIRRSTTQGRMRSSPATSTTSARALIALGVKRGDKVIWATNIPQWYITFWATTKIGAVLVTVNTAYKIHEAEYLFRPLGYAHARHDRRIPRLRLQLDNR